MQLCKVASCSKYALLICVTSKVRTLFARNENCKKETKKTGSQISFKTMRIFMIECLCSTKYNTTVGPMHHHHHAFLYFDFHLFQKSNIDKSCDVLNVDVRLLFISFHSTRLITIGFIRNRSNEQIIKFGWNWLWDSVLNQTTFQEYDYEDEPNDGTTQLAHTKSRENKKSASKLVLNREKFTNSWISLMNKSIFEDEIEEINAWFDIWCKSKRIQKTTSTTATTIARKIGRERETEKERCWIPIHAPVAQRSIING